MYMNLKPNKHKRISFNTTTMTSLGFIGPPLNLASPPKFNFLLRSPPPPNYFGLKFLGPPPPKIGGGLLPWLHDYYFNLYMYIYSDVFRVFLGRPVQTLNPQWRCHGWSQANKFLKFVLPDTLEMHSQTLPFLDFFVKHFLNYQSLHYEKHFRKWFFNNSDNQIRNLYSYKIMRAAKWSELKRCSK